MTKVKLGVILMEQKETIGTHDGNGLDLIGVSNKIGLRLSTAKRIEDLSRYKIIEKGWFSYNPMRINVGSIGYAYNDSHIGIVSPDYVVFSCSKKILPEYLLYLLKSDEGIEAINKNASGAVRKRLYFKDLSNIEIQLPPIEDQKKRLVVFRKVKELSNQIQKQLTRDNYLTQLKQSILQEAIQGKLTSDWRKQNPNIESATELLKRIKAEKQQLIADKKIKKEKPLAAIGEEEIPFELPDGWVWCRMQDSGLFQRGKSKHRPRNDKQLFENGTIPFVQTGEVARSKNTDYLINNCSTYYNDFGLAQSKLWKKGTMCITIAANIAQTGFLNIDACFPDSVVGFTALSDSNISKYIRYFIDLTKTDIEKFAPATAQKNINLGIIYLLKLPLPPEKEIIEIVKKVEALMQHCQALEQEIKTSEANAKMLMQAVLKEAFENKETLAMSIDK